MKYETIKRAGKELVIRVSRVSREELNKLVLLSSVKDFNCSPAHMHSINNLFAISVMGLYDVNPILRDLKKDLVIDVCECIHDYIGELDLHTTCELVLENATHGDSIDILELDDEMPYAVKEFIIDLDLPIYGADLTVCSDHIPEFFIDVATLIKQSSKRNY